jgi:hypothetical protein
MMSFRGLGFGFSFNSAEGLIKQEPSPSRFLDFKVDESYGF